MPYYVRRFSPHAIRRPPNLGWEHIGEEFEYPLPGRWYHPTGGLTTPGVGFVYTGLYNELGEQTELSWMWLDWEELTSPVGAPDYLQPPTEFVPQGLGGPWVIYMEPTTLSTNGKPGFRLRAEIPSNPPIFGGQSDNWVEYAFPEVGPYRFFTLIPILFPEPGWVWRDGATIEHQITAGNLYACNVCRDQSGPGLPGDPPLPGPATPAPIFP